jgi:L-ascorbate metabolism protein UlaG (beta-lactamase superfamily)
MADTALTWLGHASFRFDTPGGKRIYVDPFLNGNPKCPEAEQKPERVDIIAITHGHGDHVGDTVEIWKEHKPVVIAPVELHDLLVSKHGIDEESAHGPNKGGTVEVKGIKFSLTDANHSSSIWLGEQLVYSGEPVGYVIEVENGTTLYFAGDTNVFGDMQLIRRLYEPDVAVLPIGGHFTMDPKEAAVALEFLGVERCIPCHWGTFPLLAGTPDELRRLTDVEIVDMSPGDTITV